MKDFVHVNPLIAFKKSPKFAYYYFIKGLSRAIYLKLLGKKLRRVNYAGRKVNNIYLSNKVLKLNIRKGLPFMAGRFGNNELSLMTEVFLFKMGHTQQINMHNLIPACEHSGIFPSNQLTIESFTDVMIKTMQECDLLGVWYNLMEDYFAKFFVKNAVLTHRKIFDFWLHDSPFTEALKGKKVLVINPFSKTIQNQYAKREKLFKNKDVLPEFELKTLKSVQSIAGETCDFKDWLEALNYMYNEAVKIDFDVVILGCGAYGFPLGAMLKRYGKTVLHMGGVTQILFGIKGKRWDDDPVASQLYNEHWVRPDEDETPGNNKDVEEGCYW